MTQPTFHAHHGPKQRRHTVVPAEDGYGRPIQNNLDALAWVLRSVAPEGGWRLSLELDGAQLWSESFRGSQGYWGTEPRHQGTSLTAGPQCQAIKQAGKWVMA